MPEFLIAFCLALAFLTACVVGLLNASRAFSSEHSSLRLAYLLCSVGITGFVMAMLVSLAGQFSETRFTGVWASLNFVLLVGFVMAMPILPLLSGTTKRSYLPGQWRSVRGVVCPHSLQHLW